MKVTIAICTWNRSRLLKQTIDSIRRADVPTGLDWQLLVVDNRSTDDTKEVVESFADSLPIKYCFESQQGHSHSRNRAVCEADGDFIIWTDNDVRVDEQWLTAYVDGFQQHSQAHYFGGRIQPSFEGGMPDWLRATWDKCRAVYAWRDLGEEAVPLGNGVFPYGANFAVATQVQRQFLYNPKDGRVGQGMIGDDEISVLRAISQAGHQGVWLPDAGLQHIIPPDRATPDYIRRYFLGQGHTNVRMNKVDKTAKEAFREYWTNRFAFQWKRFLKPADEWVSHLIRSSLSHGEYLELRELERTGAE